MLASMQKRSRCTIGSDVQWLVCFAIESVVVCFQEQVFKPYAKPFGLWLSVAV